MLLFQPAEEGPGGAAVMIGDCAPPSMTTHQTHLAVRCQVVAPTMTLDIVHCGDRPAEPSKHHCWLADLHFGVSYSRIGPAARAAEGVLEGVIAAHGLHVWPVAPAGVITSRVSCADAATDEY